MDIFSIFTLLGGLAFFIYGMNVMSESLEQLAGSRLEATVDKLTKNRVTGLVLGCVLTVVIQSSSAVTVMLVGLVNSGIMSITNTVGVIMGSNIGTTVTAWIMSLIGISSDNVFIRMLKPDSFSPLLAFIGIVLIMIHRSSRAKEIGNTMIGFAVLMYGMILMSSSVESLAESPKFSEIMVAYNDPLLGILTGLVVTAVIQSSAASIGMLQALSLTGGITFGMAVPIIMGQNIGTCATAVISSIGVNQNAKRVAVIHISFNVIGTIIFMALFYLIHAFADFTFLERTVNPAGIALFHTVFNVTATAILLPMRKLLVRIAEAVIKEKKEENVLIDRRLLETPSVAILETERLIDDMAVMAKDCIMKSIDLINTYKSDVADEVRRIEEETDRYEDVLNRFLIDLSQNSISHRENRNIGYMLNAAGDLERLGDHAVNLVESAEEIKEKSMTVSDAAGKELDTIADAVREITETAIRAYVDHDYTLASKVEPLEQVIDLLVQTIRMNHINRLKDRQCTIEKGFVLADILNNYERISDHCSNIAVTVLADEDEGIAPHEFLNRFKDPENERFAEDYNKYLGKYALDALQSR